MKALKEKIVKLEKQVKAGWCSQEVHDELKALKHERDIYVKFNIACDGYWPYDQPTLAPSTHKLGVTKIKYDHKDGVLRVWLRRPGLFIGKGGATFDKMKEHLGCKIHIHEVVNLSDEQVVEKKEKQFKFGDVIECDDHSIRGQVVYSDDGDECVAYYATSGFLRRKTELKTIKIDHYSHSWKLVD